MLHECTSGSEQSLGQSRLPWLHPARSTQGFWMISLLFLNQTHSSSCVANTLLFSCWSLTLGRTRQTCRRVAKLWKCCYNRNKEHYAFSSHSRRTFHKQACSVSLSKIHIIHNSENTAVIIDSFLHLLLRGILKGSWRVCTLNKPACQSRKVRKFCS